MVLIAPFGNTGKMPSGQVVSLSYVVYTPQRARPTNEECLNKQFEANYGVGRPISIAEATVPNAFGEGRTRSEAVNM